MRIQYTIRRRFQTQTVATNKNASKDQAGRQTRQDIECEKGNVLTQLELEEHAARSRAKFSGNKRGRH